MSFCRITGSARNLPKPTYFPMLKPISPADAKKLCRITGKVNDAHCFSPVISFGKPFKGDGMQGCKITKNEDFNFVKPSFKITKDNEKAYKYFEEVLERMRNIPIKKKEVEVMRDYGYNIIEHFTTIVFPPEMEEGIRMGEFESINMDKASKYINVKIRQGRIVKIDLEKLQKSDLDQYDNLYYGRGPNSDVIKDNQKLIDERNQRKQNTMAMKRKFEGLEHKAEEEYLKDVERPKCKKPRVKFDPQKRREKMEKMQKMLKEQEQNKALVLPKMDPMVVKDDDLAYERYIHDTVYSFSQSTCMAVVAKGYNWADVDAPPGFDFSAFKHEEWIEPSTVAGTTVHPEDVVCEDVVRLEVVVTIEAVTPAKAMSKEMTRAITKLKTKTEALMTTEKVSENVKELKCSQVLPKLKDIDKVAENIEKARVGYMTQDSQGDATFVLKEDFTPGGPGKVIAGAMVQVDGIEKFVSGQVVTIDEKEVFVPGQTREFEEKGLKFVLGQTVVDEAGDVKFVPGHCLKNEDEKTVFVAGQIFPTADGPRFIPGQIMSRGDGPEIFVSGQTVMTEDGPKFMPGEVTIDKWEEEVFVPGMTMPTAEGGKFVAGQTFQKDDGELSFTPGQIIDTVEGPSFVPGQTFETAEGTKFVQGELVVEDGKVRFEQRDYAVPEALKEEPEDHVQEPKIPNEQLQPLAFADRNVSGFVVNPINTSNITAGEKLYGDMVETEESVQFYIAGKLPPDLPTDTKIIPGQLIVGDAEQRFVPGKQMDTADGEKFIPGQVVFTTHGEEFVPGQVVETAEGPKFVPGQLVHTIQGEKFVPGQVIVEEEGPKFVPGQIIQTKNGATFIPGQMMTTEEGHKFVPGQLVETKDGPRFVPGQVHETADGPKFIPGTIIETEDGLRYVPPDGEEYDEEIDIIAFQGFDISPEELKLLSTNPADVQPHEVIVDERCLIDSATLKKLADTSVPVHGRTPSPQPEKKKKKRKRAKVAIDAPEEGDKMDVVEPDEGTEKSELIKKLLKASSCVTKSKKEKEMKKLSFALGDTEHDTVSAVQLEAMSMLLNPPTKIADAFKAYLGDDEELISDILMNVCETEDNERNDVVVRELRTAIQGVVSAKCDQEISKIIHQLDSNPENLFTDERIQILLTEAVGIVCVTGNVEVASLLEKFISEPTDPNVLREDKDVVAVLRQLIVLHQIADRDPEVARCLQQLMSNPETLKDKRGIRDLLQAANFLLEKPKDANEKKAEKKEKFDLRHVASSKDIPTDMFEKIKEDRKEASKFLENLPDELFKTLIGDDRCGERLMESLSSDKADRSKQDLKRFKEGMAVVVTKGEVQAVIPKEMARSIYYGIMPYIMIDEEGFKFFEKGLTGRKLAPPKVIENNWYMPDSYYERRPLYQRTLSGEMYEMVLLGQSWQPNTSGMAASGMQYTSLLPSSGPTRISLVEPSGNKPSSRGSTPKRPSMMDVSDVNLQRSSVERRINSRADFAGDPIDLSRRHRSVDRRTETNGMLPLTESYNQLAKYSSDYKEQNDVSRSVVPYKSQNEDEDDDEGGGFNAPIGRSDTVTNLLHKYTNFSEKREFGYHKPESAYARLMNKTNKSTAPTSRYAATLEDEEDEYGMTSTERSQMPPSKQEIIRNVQHRQKRPQQNESDDFGDSLSREQSYAPRSTSIMREGSQIPRGVSTVRESSQIPHGASTVREGSHMPRGVSTARDGSAYDNGVDLYPKDMSIIQRNFYDPYEEDEDMEGDSYYNKTGSTNQPTENNKPTGLSDQISTFLTRQNQREEEKMSRRKPMRSIEQLIEDELPEEEKSHFKGKFKSKGMSKLQEEEDDEPLLVGAEKDFAHRRTPSQLRELLEENEPPILTNNRSRKPMSSIQDDDDMLYSPRTTRKPYTHRNTSQLMEDDEDLTSTRSTRKPYTQRNNSHLMEDDEDLPRLNQRRSSANRYIDNNQEDDYGRGIKKAGRGKDIRSGGISEGKQQGVSGRGDRQAPSQGRYNDQDEYGSGYGGKDRYSYGGQDQYGSGQERYGSVGMDRHGGQNRYGGSQDRHGGQDRYGGSQDRYGGGTDSYGGQQRGPQPGRYGASQDGQPGGYGGQQGGYGGKQGGYGGQQGGYGGPPDNYGAPRGAPSRGSRGSSNRARPSGPPPRRGPPQDYDDGYNQYQPQQPSYGGGNDGYGGMDYGYGGSVVGYASDPLLSMKNIYPSVGLDDNLHPRTQERRLASKLARQYIRDEPE